MTTRRNLAYCLGELNITDKHIKRLAESFKLYKDALVDSQVYDNFTTIVAKVFFDLTFPSLALHLPFPYLTLPYLTLLYLLYLYLPFFLLNLS